MGNWLWKNMVRIKTDTETGARVASTRRGLCTDLLRGIIADSRRQRELDGSHPGRYPRPALEGFDGRTGTFPPRFPQLCSRRAGGAEPWLAQAQDSGRRPDSGQRPGAGAAAGARRAEQAAAGPACPWSWLGGIALLAFAVRAWIATSSTRRCSSSALSSTHGSPLGEGIAGAAVVARHQSRSRIRLLPRPAAEARRRIPAGGEHAAGALGSAVCAPRRARRAGFRRPSRRPRRRRLLALYGRLVYIELSLFAEGFFIFLVLGLWVLTGPRPPGDRTVRSALAPAAPSASPPPRGPRPCPCCRSRPASCSSAGRMAAPRRRLDVARLAGRRGAGHRAGAGAERRLAAGAVVRRPQLLHGQPHRRLRHARGPAGQRLGRALLRARAARHQRRRRTRVLHEKARREIAAEPLAFAAGLGRKALWRLQAERFATWSTSSASRCRRSPGSPASGCCCRWRYGAAGWRGAGSRRSSGCTWPSSSSPTSPSSWRRATASRWCRCSRARRRGGRVARRAAAARPVRSSRLPSPSSSPSPWCRGCGSPGRATTSPRVGAHRRLAADPQALRRGGGRWSGRWPRTLAGRTPWCSAPTCSSGPATRRRPEALRAAVAASPDYQQARLGLGMALARRHDLPGAERELRHALWVVPGDASVLAELGGVLLASGKVEEAGDDVPAAGREGAAAGRGLDRSRPPRGSRPAARRGSRDGGEGHGRGTGPRRRLDPLGHAVARGTATRPRRRGRSPPPRSSPAPTRRRSPSAGRCSPPPGRPGPRPPPARRAAAQPGLRRGGGCAGQRGGARPTRGGRGLPRRAARRRLLVRAAIPDVVRSAAVAAVQDHAAHQRREEVEAGAGGGEGLAGLAVAAGRREAKPSARRPPSRVSTTTLFQVTGTPDG